MYKTTAKKLHAFILLLTAVVILLFNPILVLAEEEGGFNGQLKTQTDLSTPWKAYDALGNLISVLLTLFIIASALMAFGFFIFGAIQWGMAKGGDGAAKARSTMIYAAVGLILVACVYVFMLFYNSILPSG